MIGAIVACSHDPVPRELSQVKPVTALDSQKGAAWQEGTKLLTEWLWSPEYAEWSKITDTSGVCYLGPNEDNKNTFLIGGKVQTKNAYNQWIMNLFSATVVCYGTNDWRLVSWEFEEIP